MRRQLPCHLVPVHTAQTNQAEDRLHRLLEVLALFDLASKPGGLVNGLADVRLQPTGAKVLEHHPNPECAKASTQGYRPVLELWVVDRHVLYVRHKDARGREHVQQELAITDPQEGTVEAAEEPLRAIHVHGGHHFTHRLRVLAELVQRPGSTRVGSVHVDPKVVLRQILECFHIVAAGGVGGPIGQNQSCGLQACCTILLHGRLHVAGVQSVVALQPCRHFADPQPGQAAGLLSAEVGLV
mmetsp:Transcript_36812/g.87899  ORF Transcript_36812/g.87899 Transcript_36812/m.87899 type:complete len:241 (+) Transcript_36812:231-953(+)